jgi:phosphohistidine phosphatase SixA
VFLVRHAEAEPGKPDDLRRLTSHGRWQAKDLGKRFDRKGISVDAIVSSPLVRARETAEGMAAVLGATAQTDERLAPGATTDDLRAAVAGRGETVVVIGHQPDCGKIAADLTGGPEPSYPTAGVRELDV